MQSKGKSQHQSVRVMEQICPRCQTSSYQKPSMKLLVNVCGHRLCELCVDAIFTRPSAACPQCGVPLRRNQFRVQQFEDDYVEKDVNIRKKVLKDYNKREEDFGSLEEYNDYLEQVEIIIFNLTNNIDEEATKKMIEEYRRNNQTLILKNRAKQERDSQAFKAQMDMEQLEKELRRKEEKMEIEAAEKAKRKNKESLLEDLSYSNLSATEVLANHVVPAHEPSATKHSSSLQPSLLTSSMGSASFEPIPFEQGEVYHYEPLVMETIGPSTPLIEDLSSQGYLQHIREVPIGGGFNSSMACQRALQEAFSCLLMNSNHLRGDMSHDIT